MAIDLASVVIIGLFSAIGWRRGLLRVVISLLGLAGAYMAALWFARPAGALLADRFELQPLVAVPLGGSAVFALGLVLSGVISFFARDAYPCKAEHPVLHRFNKAGGALAGAAYGGIVAFLLVWAVSLASAAGVKLPVDPQDARVAGIARPALSRLTREVAHRASGSAVVADAAGRFTESPVAAVKSVTRLAQNRRIQAVLDDRRALRLLAAGDLERLGRHPKLRALARDPALVADLQALGLLPLPAEQGVGQADPEAVAALLAPMGRVLATLRHDPQARKLLRDPRLADKLKRRDMVELAQDPQFNALMERVLAALRAEKVATEERGGDQAVDVHRQGEPAEAADPSERGSSVPASTGPGGAGEEPDRR